MFSFRFWSEALGAGVASGTAKRMQLISRLRKLSRHRRCPGLFNPPRQTSPACALIPDPSPAASTGSAGQGDAHRPAGEYFMDVCFVDNGREPARKFGRGAKDAQRDARHIVVANSARLSEAQRVGPNAGERG